MAKTLFSLFILLTPILNFASESCDFREVAQNHLNTSWIELYQESEKSYFFVTKIYLDFTEDKLCTNGVIIDKKSCRVIDPLDPYRDESIQITFPYTDTRVNSRLIVINCND